VKSGKFGLNFRPQFSLSRPVLLRTIFMSVKASRRPLFSRNLQPIGTDRSGKPLFLEEFATRTTYWKQFSSNKKQWLNLSDTFKALISQTAKWARQSISEVILFDTKGLTQTFRLSLPILQVAKKCRIWPWLSTLVVLSDCRSFRNGATYRKLKTLLGSSADNCSVTSPNVARTVRSTQLWQLRVIWDPEKWAGKIRCIISNSTMHRPTMHKFARLA